MTTTEDQTTDVPHAGEPDMSTNVDTDDPAAAENSAPADVSPMGDSDPETFPRAYVEQLRDESAKYRQRATRADEAAQRLLETTVRSAAADHLADPADLLAFGDTDTLLDPDGWPDADRIIAAAQSLAQAKPHLAPRRPRGDIGQGATPTGDSVNLAAILRAGAS